MTTLDEILLFVLLCMVLGSGLAVGYFEGWVRGAADASARLHVEWDASTERLVAAWRASNVRIFAAWKAAREARP